MSIQRQIKTVLSSIRAKNFKVCTSPEDFFYFLLQVFFPFGIWLAGRWPKKIRTSTECETLPRIHLYLYHLRAEVFTNSSPVGAQLSYAPKNIYFFHVIFCFMLCSEWKTKFNTRSGLKVTQWKCFSCIAWLFFESMRSNKVLFARKIKPFFGLLVCSTDRFLFF